MKRYQYNDLTIEILDEQDYRFGPAGNYFSYKKQYFGIDAQEYPTSKHGIKVWRDDQVIDSCIIIGSGGTTGVHQNSSLLDDEHLLLCCCDTIFCLTLPCLKLEWKTQADPATCFQVFKLQDDYAVHGEFQIVRIDKKGKIKWEFGAADIFVSVDYKEEFKIENDGILLTDFSNTKYKIDFDGRLIWDTYGSYN
ncbi:hypothetical protein [Sphingobacterium gobiense]|uniref:Uncharacterized protein n=1 Tax=Sphingobacterium gobiense TaxID=1382456 RepID=A0A2S9JUK6_9SPHI|nr:hypothetical protein [Sphingobacterium gobiense]PRD56801.1 hypothetical protein C5749_06135 [Sphingobacterium gobiense]